MAHKHLATYPTLPGNVIYYDEYLGKFFRLGTSNESILNINLKSPPIEVGVDVNIFDARNYLVIQYWEEV